MNECRTILDDWEAISYECRDTKNRCKETTERCESIKNQCGERKKECNSRKKSCGDKKNWCGDKKRGKSSFLSQREVGRFYLTSIPLAIRGSFLRFQFLSSIILRRSFVL